MRFWELNERVSPQHLYHATDPDVAIKICQSDRLMGMTNHTQKSLGMGPSTARADWVAGVSLTRDRRFATQYRNGSVVTFVLNRERLRQKYQLRCIDYYGSNYKSALNTREEAEEFLIGSVGISPLSRYCETILIPRHIYDKLINKPEASPLIDHPKLEIIEPIGESTLMEVVGTFGFYHPATDTEVRTPGGADRDHADYVAEHPMEFGITASDIAALDSADRTAWMAGVIDLTLARGWVRVNQYRGAWSFQAATEKLLRRAVREYDRQMDGIEEANCDVGLNSARPDVGFTLHPYEAVQAFIRTGQRPR